MRRRGIGIGGIGGIGGIAEIVAIAGIGGTAEIVGIAGIGVPCARGKGAATASLTPAHGNRESPVRSPTGGVQTPPKGRSSIWRPIAVRRRRPGGAGEASRRAFGCRAGRETPICGAISERGCPGPPKGSFVAVAPKIPSSGRDFERRPGEPVGVGTPGGRRFGKGPDFSEFGRSAHKARRFRARNRRSPVGGVPTRLRARSRLRRAKNGSKLPIPGRRAGGGHAQRHTGPWRSRPPCLPGEPGICAGPAAPQRLPQPASAGLVRGRGREALACGLDPAFTPGRRAPRPSLPLPCLGTPLQRACSAAGP